MKTGDTDNNLLHYGGHTEYNSLDETSDTIYTSRPLLVLGSGNAPSPDLRRNGQVASASQYQEGTLESTMTKPAMAPPVSRYEVTLEAYRAHLAGDVQGVKLALAAITIQERNEALRELNSRPPMDDAEAVLDLLKVAYGDPVQ